MTSSIYLLQQATISCTSYSILLPEGVFSLRTKGWPWSLFTAIEDDSEDDTMKLEAVYLLLVYGHGKYSVIDKRPLR